MKPKLVFGLVLVIASIGFGVTAFKNSLTPYISFAEAKRSGANSQVNGTLADPASVRYDAEKSELAFALRDDKNEVMPVVYHGVKPANFEQATSVVAIGQFKDGRFEAEQLLVKCPSKYQAEGGAMPAATGPARSGAPATGEGGGY
jgi:cytochrome c-type biogenesis protein CcmE